MPESTQPVAFSLQQLDQLIDHVDRHESDCESQDHRSVTSRLSPDNAATRFRNCFATAGMFPLRSALCQATGSGMATASDCSQS